jgi:arylsulfatase A-like enzyme
VPKASQRLVPHPAAGLPPGTGRGGAAAGRGRRALARGGRRLAALLPALLVGCGEGGVAASEPPNVLFVLLDDLRWDALGAYGNPAVRTPELDAFAAQGARFERFYVASPVCSPSRASFLTGLHPHAPGIELGAGGRPFTVAPGVATVASELAASGYATGFVGKAHLDGDPRRWGFREQPIVIPGRRLTDPGPADVQRLEVAGRVEHFRGHVTERLADAAIDFIERHRDEKWGLWLATTAPHEPYTPDPDTPFSPHSLGPPPGWPEGQPLIDREDWAHYYSLMGRVDRELGRILRHLDALGLAERTLVWITSDNGVQLGSHGLEGKGVWYDASTRVPALVRWPGKIAAGSVVTSLASSVDLLPTLLDVAGRPRRCDLRGFSLLPVLQGGESARSHAFSEVLRGGPAEAKAWQMVTDGRLKLIAIPDGDRLMFDLARDPSELRDVSEEGGYSRARAELEGRLARWKEAAGAEPECGGGTRSR